MFYLQPFNRSSLIIVASEGICQLLNDKRKNRDCERIHLEILKKGKGKLIVF